MPDQLRPVVGGIVSGRVVRSHGRRIGLRHEVRTSGRTDRASPGRRVHLRDADARHRAPTHHRRCAAFRTRSSRRRVSEAGIQARRKSARRSASRVAGPDFQARARWFESSGARQSQSVKRLRRCGELQKIAPCDTHIEARSSTQASPTALRSRAIRVSSLLVCRISPPKRPTPIGTCSQYRLV